MQKKERKKKKRKEGGSEECLRLEGQFEARIRNFENSHCGAVEVNLTRIHEDVGSIPGFVGQESGIAVSCDVGRRRSSDPVLLWL